jgi:hypothetical protein
MGEGAFLPDREELAWAAGLFDGEGCFSYTERAGFGVATISQVDRRVLDRFQRAVGGLGKVYGPYASRSSDRYRRKAQYRYSAHRRADLQAVVALLWFKLGPVKRAQAVGVLRRLMKRCSKGHLLVQSRGCPECVADAWSAKRLARKGAGASAPRRTSM